MEALRITYELVGRPGRREYLMPYKPGRMTAPDIARALMQHEILEIDLPFDSMDAELAELVLKRFGIVNITRSPMRIPEDSN